MPAKVENRRNFLINLLFVAAVLGLIYVFLKYLFWVTAPFLLSFLFAIILQRPLRWLDKKTDKKCHTLFSILLIIFVVAIILVPLIFILSALATKIGEFIKYLIDLTSDIPTLLTTLETKLLDFGKFLPEGIYKTYSTTLTSWFDNLLADTSAVISDIDMSKITSGISSGISGVYGVVKNVPSFLIGLIIGIIAWIFFTKDYDRIVRFIQLQFPKEKKNLLVEIKQVFSKTIMKMVRAYCLIMFITFMELVLGMGILRLVGIMENNYFVLIAVGIALFDILPVAGSGGILIPWALFSFIMGNYQQGIGLLVIYVIISVIRQYIEPKIVGDSLGVHPLITLMGLYFGLKFFGFLGMFVVPLTVMTLKAFNDTGRIQLWKTPDRN